MNILVTGGCGFIGSHFINYMLAKYTDLRIINIDCLNYCSNEKNVIPNDRYKLVRANITSKDFVSHILKEYSIDHIVHFAAQTHVDNSFDNSLQYTIDNVFGTHTLLQASKEYGKLKRFIHFSTDEVYGEVDSSHPGCTEISLLNPTNPYAATKAAAEFIVRSYYHSFKLPVIITRCNNVYGPNQYPEKLIPKFIQLLRDNKKLTIHGDGKARRNFIWVDDVSSATEFILQKGQVNEIYNIGTKQEYSVMEIATILIGEMKNSNTVGDYIEHVEDRPFNDSRYSVDTQRLHNLGWEEKNTDFRKNVIDLIHKS